MNRLSPADYTDVTGPVSAIDVLIEQEAEALLKATPGGSEFYERQARIEDMQRDREAMIRPVDPGTSKGDAGNINSAGGTGPATPNEDADLILLGALIDAGYRFRDFDGRGGRVYERPVTGTTPTDYDLVTVKRAPRCF